MSAYIVDDETIDRIVNYVKFTQNGEEAAQRILQKYVIDPEKLGRELFALNVEAVRQRYSDCKSIEDMPGKIGHYEYVHTPSINGNRFQILKSMKCWLYQCSEGDVPKRPLFKAIEELSNDLAHTIVGGMPEYERARWA